MFRRPAGSKSETENHTPAVPPNQVNPTSATTERLNKEMWAPEPGSPMYKQPAVQEPKPANPFTLLSAFESLVHQMNGAPVRHSYGGQSYSIVISEQHRAWFNEILTAVKTVNALDQEIKRLDQLPPHVGDYVAGVVSGRLKSAPATLSTRPAPKFPIGTEVIDWRCTFHSAVRKVTKHEFREGKWWYSRLENGACIFPEDDLRPARPSVIQTIEEVVDRVETKNAREQKFQIGTLVLEPILQRPREIAEARFWPSENVWMYRLANRFGWYAESTLKEAK